MSGVARTYYPVAPLPDTNARQAAITQRPASTALLTIDSEDRYTDYIQARADPSSPYNFTIRKNESLMPGFMTRIGVSEVTFPWVIPNITERCNEMIVSWSIGGLISTGVISVEPGFYTPVELADSIQTKIQALDPTLSAATFEYYGPVNPVGLYFSYSTGSTTTIDFNPLPYNTTGYPYPPTTKQLFDVLGFTTLNSVYATEGSGRETLCQSVRYIDIVCNQLTNSQAQKDQTSQSVARDMLCRIYLADAVGSTNMIAAPNTAEFCPPGCAPAILYRNFSTPKQIQWIPNQNIPGYLQFTVYDDTGLSLDTIFYSTEGSTAIYSGADWSMTMLVTEN